jgi:UDP-3-O-[3-hydroxymyristoyl] glucosamine N-acyltransferase
MNLSCSDLLSTLEKKAIAAKLIGNDNSILSIEPIERCSKGSLTFAEKPSYLSTALQHQVAAVVVPDDMLVTDQPLGITSLIQVADVRVALAYIRQQHDDHPYQNNWPHQSEWQRIHPTAVIHESVLVPETAVIGPGAVIGSEVVLADNVVVMANAVIELKASIGEGSIIHPCCVIGWGCDIEANVVIKAGAIIGAEGHGFARDSQGRFHRIPQRGKVVIENNVVIGANCTIDRATYHETRIHRGCIIDAQCHLAHNVVLDEDCALVAQTGIAGSSRFGKRVMASGQTGVLDHVSVPDDTVLVHRAGVINSIKQSGMYATTPPQPFARYLKNIAVFQRLSEVWIRLRALEKKVAEMTEKL